MVKPSNLERARSTLWIRVKTTFWIRAKHTFPFGVASVNWKKWSARKENNLSCSDHHSADLAKQCITQFHIFHRSVTTYPTRRRLLNSAAKKLWAIHKYRDRFLLRFMGLKEADLLLKNYNFIKTYWLKVVGYGFPIFCMSSDLAKLHLFKVFKEYLNRAIPMFLCNEWPWCN